MEVHVIWRPGNPACGISCPPVLSASNMASPTEIHITAICSRLGCRYRKVDAHHSVLLTLPAYNILLAGNILEAGDRTVPHCHEILAGSGKLVKCSSGATGGSREYCATWILVRSAWGSAIN